MVCVCASIRKVVFVNTHKNIGGTNNKQQKTNTHTNLRTFPRESNESIFDWIAKSSRKLMEDFARQGGQQQEQAGKRQKDFLKYTSSSS